MKNIHIKIIAILILATSTSIATDLYGHATNTFKPKCTAFNKKYKSRAVARGNDFWSSFGGCSKSDKDCYGSSASCSHSEEGKECAYAQAIASGNTNYTYTYTERGCSAGLGMTDLNQQMYSSALKDKIYDTKSVTSINYEQVLDNDQRTFTIKKVNGYLEATKNSLGYAEFRITIWRAEDDYINQVEDTEITEEKILHEEYIRIRNGKIESSNAFLNNKLIEVIENEKVVKLELQNFYHVFSIDENVNIDEELTVTISAYSDIDNDKVLDEGLKHSNKIEVFPNPSDGLLQMDLGVLESDQPVEIKLFNSNGQFVEVLYSGVLQENNKTFNLAEKYGSGVYYITVTSNEFIESKRIILLQKE